MGSPFHSERVVCLAGLGLLWERKDKRYGELCLCVFFGFLFFFKFVSFLDDVVERSSRAFENKENSFHKIKFNYFV